MPNTRSLFRPILWRAIPVLGILVLAVLAFRNGVDVGGHGDIPDDTFVVQLYYAIGLFALGGMDLGMPVGGPLVWRRVLIACYFAAPVLAAAAVIEALSRAIWSRLVALWPWRRHIVVAGGGRVARAVDVETGASDNVNVVLESGIREGDPVIVGPSRMLETLEDGQQVLFDPEEHSR